MRVSGCRVGACKCRRPRSHHSSRGLPRRGDGSRGRSPGARRAASVTRRQMLCLLVAKTAFLSCFLLIIFLFTPRPLCTVVGGFHCPWLRVGVSALTPLAAVGFHGCGVWVNLKNEALLGPSLGSLCFVPSSCFSKHWGSCEWFWLNCLNLFLSLASLRPCQTQASSPLCLGG